MLPAFLTTILFSLSAVCAQRTSKALGGVSANFWRLLLATFVLASWAHTLGQGVSGVAFPLMVLSGVLGFGLGDVLLYQALPRLGSRLSILLVHCLATPFAATTEWLWLGTNMSRLETLGAALILFGVALALAPGKHLNIPRRTFWIGVACGVIAALGQAMGAVLSGHASRVDARAGTPVDGLTAAYQRILAGVAVAALFWLTVKLRGETGEVADERAEASETGSLRLSSHFLPPNSLWPWILVNALTGPALGVGCYQWALMRQGTGIVLPIVALTPLVIIPFSRFVEGERPTKRSLIGGAVAVIGAVVLATAVAGKHS
jgi:drug/metabolite transporter (DMT)-like permease